VNVFPRHCEETKNVTGVTAGYVPIKKIQENQEVHEEITLEVHHSDANAPQLQCKQRHFSLVEWLSYRFQK
jgi:hypothetical protein